MIKLTFAQVNEISNYTQRREAAQKKWGELFKAPISEARLTMVAVGDVKHGEHARGNTELGKLLKQTLLDYYKGEIELCDRELLALGVEVAA